MDRTPTQDQGYYESPVQRRGDVPSLYAAYEYSHDYADEEVWCTKRLSELAIYWSNELKSDERSPRAKTEIDRLLGRIVFEIDMRGDRT